MTAFSRRNKAANAPRKGPPTPRRMTTLCIKARRQILVSYRQMSYEDDICLETPRHRGTSTRLKSPELATTHSPPRRVGACSHRVAQARRPSIRYVVTGNTIAGVDTQPGNRDPGGCTRSCCTACRITALYEVRFLGTVRFLQCDCASRFVVCRLLLPCGRSSPYVPRARTRARSRSRSP